MPQGSDLAFVNPGRPELVLRRAPAMSPQMGPGPAPITTVATNLGAGNYGTAFDNVVDYAASNFGVPRGVGARVSKVTRDAVGGFVRGRQQQRAARTATNAQRGGRDQTPPPTGTGRNRSNDRRRKRDGDATSARGGNPSIPGTDKMPIKFPVLTGHLSTIEGGPLPRTAQEEDYISQLHIASYSLATWSNTVGLEVDIYNPNSIKNQQVELIFGRLLNDLLKEVTTKFTDTFTLDNFKNYMNAFIVSVEYITYLESVLAYDSKSGYSDKFIANEHLQETYTSYEVIDAIKRLKTVLKNKYFPPKLMGIIHATYQLHKNQNLEQNVNFRFCPIPQGLPLLNAIESLNDLDAANAQIRTNVVTKINSLIAVLSQRDYTFVSKAIGYIRPGYIFDTVPAPISAPTYDPMFVELMINLPRIYKVDGATTNYSYPSAATGVDRPYYVSQEVSNLNSSVFAMQSQLVTGTTGFAKSDITNFGTTFPLYPSASADSYGNMWSMVTKLSGTTTIPAFEMENSIESFAIGRGNILVWSGDVGAALPTKKYSITPPNCQRVYFNNTFAPTDAVRKLVDDILDMN